MRSVSFPFYKSKAWKECRAAYMHSVSGLCEECMKQGIVKAADIVHHKITLDDEKARDPEIALNFENLQAVCIDCHNRLHGSKALPKRYRGCVAGKTRGIGGATSTYDVRFHRSRRERRSNADRRILDISINKNLNYGGDHKMTDYS